MRIQKVAPLSLTPKARIEAAAPTPVKGFLAHEQKSKITRSGASI